MSWWAHASPAVMRGYYPTLASNHIMCACMLRLPYGEAGVGVGPPYFEAFCMQLMLTSNKRHQVSSHCVKSSYWHYYHDLSKVFGKMIHFFILPCGTCQAFSLLGIAILCSGSSNFCFETILHSLIPLCGKILKDRSLKLGTSKMWAGPKIYKLNPLM